jgi:hypothetical protein
MEYEEVPFLLARHVPLEKFGCIVTTLPRPWLQAFDMISAFRFPHDIQIELVHEGEYVRVESTGGSKSRTHIDVAEIYSIQMQDIKKASFMTSLKELRAVFDLAVQICSMVNMYYNSSCDEGPLVIHVPSPSGVSLELTCSTLPPETVSVYDEEDPQTTKKVVSEDEFVAESANDGSDIEIPATPPLDYP